MATLTFAQDFTSSINLDSSLVGIPDSGFYWNRGVHPLINIDNILAHLPSLDLSFTAWDNGTTYSKFETSKNKTDIVSYNSKVYESLQASNVGNQPDTSSAYWLETNIESLRIKSFLWTVDENFKSALQLSRSLIENQYIYNLGKSLKTLSSGYHGWAFEPKNSDYVKIVINQISFQANTDVPQSLYVVNQGRLIDTLTLNPNNGLLEFEEIAYTISGKGAFYFVFDSQDVISENAYNDALRYEGFVAYPIVGTGASPQAATYAETYQGNGLNFNVSCYLDSGVYVDNNEVLLAKFKQAQFEIDVMNMFLYNANIQSNRNERVASMTEMKSLIATESLDNQLNTVARKYKYELKNAKDAINRTFDSFLKPKSKFSIKKTVL